MILTVIFGGLFYLSPKLKQQNTDILKSNIALKININDDDKYKNFNNKDVLSYTKAYLENESEILSSNYTINVNSKETLDISSIKDKTDLDKDRLINSLEKKTYLTVTDKDGNPLFYKGIYIPKYYAADMPESNKKFTLKDFINEGSENFNMSLQANPASLSNKNGLTNRVEIKLDQKGWDQFVKMTNEYYLMYSYSLQQQNQEYDPKDNPANKVYFWINLEEFIQEAKTNYPEEWKASGENPVNFAYINNQSAPKAIYKTDSNGQKNLERVDNPVLKYHQINARKYLISSIVPWGLLSKDKLSSSFTLLNNNKQGLTDKELANAINFAYAPFSLKEEYSYFEKSKKAGNLYLVAISIIFALFAVFLIVRFRVFGLIATILISLFMFVVLSIISAFGITINPIVAFTLLISFFIGFLILNNHLEIFKRETLQGGNANKAIKKSNKNGLISNLDALVGLTIVSLIAIFINVAYINTIGIIMFISIFAMLIFANIIPLLLFRSIVKTESFDDKLKLLVWNSSKLNVLNEKFDLIKKAKYYFIGFALFIIMSLIFIGIYSGAFSSSVNGLYLSSQASQNYELVIGSQNNNLKINLDQALKISQLIKEKNVALSVEPILNNIQEQTYLINVISKNDLTDIFNNSLLSDIQSILNTQDKISFVSYQLSSESIVKDTGFVILLIVLSLIFNFIYMTIRYSLVNAIILVIKNVLVFISIFAWMFITYTQFNYSIFGVFILITMFNVVDDYMLSSQLKGEFSHDLTTKNFIYSKEDLSKMFKLFANQIFVRNLFTFLFAIVFIIANLNLITDLNSTFVLGFSFGLISTAFINQFLITYIWMKLLNRKYQIKEKRIKNKYWKTEKIEEQTFIGINDFSI
ncbi:peptide transporter [[Mycoplasma] falconis]|uniref:Peptide transporter n=2 Tax=[Mycoplasma] falconis TaxID=92403 RepID=A0A501XAP7_9BACT|nr:peptide transporter [[Mycoplasma] falconis]TPE57433.1 peptide transporter [[Mycoplasma] falconis]